MNWTLPGTLLATRLEDADKTGELFNSMFLPGGMVLSQVSGITGLESYMIQNWVKRGYLSPPVGKRYTLRQLCRIININLLRGTLTMEEICGLLASVNGQLDDESDDLIDDSLLYFMFVSLAARGEDRQDINQSEELLGQVLDRFPEPVPGARERIALVLRVMLAAWYSARLRNQAQTLLEQIKNPS